LSCTDQDSMELRHAIRSRLLSQASLQHRMCVVVHNAHKLDEQTLAFIEDLSREHSLYLPLCHIVLLVDKAYANKIAKKKRTGQARHVHHYVEFRLEQACASNSDLFDETLVNQIFRQTQGKPQLINALCDRTLCNAALDGESQIVQKHVVEAVAQLGWTSRLSPARTASQSASSLRKKASTTKTKPSTKSPDALPEMGALERSVHELVSGVTTIGRAPDCAIRLEGSHFSPYQALIVRTEDGMFIRNEGSQVPLYLNGGTVDSANLGAGDCVRLGSYQFSVNRDEQGKLSLVATEASA